jgi:hypothetical protein
MFSGVKKINLRMRWSAASQATNPSGFQPGHMDDMAVTGRTAGRVGLFLEEQLAIGGEVNA